MVRVSPRIGSWAYLQKRKKKRELLEKGHHTEAESTAVCKRMNGHSSHRLALLKVAFHRTIVAFSISLFSNGDEGLSPLAPPAPPPKNEAAADRGLYGVIVRKIIGSCFSKDWILGPFAKEKKKGLNL